MLYEVGENEDGIREGSYLRNARLWRAVALEMSENEDARVMADAGVAGMGGGTVRCRCRAPCEPSLYSSVMKPCGLG